MKKILLFICVLAVTTAGGQEVRSIPFRQVLWGVARKAGYSPESGNFLSNQAIPIGEYIDQWVDRLWANEDWPELVKIVQLAPDANHIVPYDPLVQNQPTDQQVHIGRVLEVYLVDPKTTNVPITTKFTLRSDGVHCGYEHGTNVWIKYMEPPPVFTAIPWLPQNTYANGDVVYSPVTGQVYKSKVDYNIGHDPSSVVITPLPNQIPTSEIQPFQAQSLGTNAQSKIITVDIGHLLGPNPPGIPVADPPAVSAQFNVPVMDNTGTLIFLATHNTVGAETLAAVVADLVSKLIAGLGGGWTVTNTGFVISITHASDFVVVSPNAGAEFPEYFSTSSAAPAVFMNTVLQPFVAATSSAMITQQVSKVTYPSTVLIPGALYSITFTDGNGAPHVASYQSTTVDSSQAIMTGILGAVQSAAVGDTFIATINPSLDLTSNSLTFSTNAQMSVHATQVKAGSPWWDIVPFPVRMENAVIRGASADLLAEWGQSDKATSEEGKIPLAAERDTMNDDVTPTITPAYTTQQRAYSRYKY